MKKIILIVSLLLAGNAFAMPITPQPLRKLINNSQNIIIGYVVQTGKNPAQRVVGWGGQIATIEVLEVLKGENIDDTIVVEFSPNLISPNPDRYIDSTFVVAFLYHDSLGYVTQAYDYGLKTFSRENKQQTEIFKSRINEMLTILEEPDEFDKKIKTVDWLVTCIEHESTRWDGMYELTPESDFMSSYDKDSTIDFQCYLDSLQYDRIKNALLASDSLIYSNVGLFDLLNSKYHRQANEWLIDKMISLNPDNYWMSRYVMWRINLYLNDLKLYSLSIKYDKIEFDDNYDKNEIKIVKKYIKRLKQVVK